MGDCEEVLPSLVEAKKLETKDYHKRALVGVRFDLFAGAHLPDYPIMLFLIQRLFQGSSQLRLFHLGVTPCASCADMTRPCVSNSIS